MVAEIEQVIEKWHKKTLVVAVIVPQFDRSTDLN
jgi:hypothetical protein